MKFNFFVDDNIFVFRDLTNNNCNSLFDNDYLNMFRKLHEKYGLAVQLNAFYSTEGFTLEDMTDKFKNEWQQNSDWLKLAFHSFAEFPDDPYINADYEEVDRDCKKILGEIRRFAEENCINYATTIHFMEMSQEGCRALLDNGIKGIAGMFSTPNNPVKKYYLEDEKIKCFDNNVKIEDKGMTFTNLDLVLNCHSVAEIKPLLAPKIGRELIQVMIHEQYFHKFYSAYNPDYKEKIEAAVSFLCENGYESTFMTV